MCVCGGGRVLYVYKNTLIMFTFHGWINNREALMLSVTPIFACYLIHTASRKLYWKSITWLNSESKAWILIGYNLYVCAKQEKRFCAKRLHFLQEFHFSLGN